LKLEDGNTEPRTGQDNRYPEQKWHDVFKHFFFFFIKRKEILMRNSQIKKEKKEEKERAL
jgi:hypothetical protein